MLRVKQFVFGDENDVLLSNFPVMSDELAYNKSNSKLHIMLKGKCNIEGMIKCLICST